MAIHTIDTCGNCGRKIGKLEEPKELGDHIVCPDCYNKLRAAKIVGYAQRAKSSGAGSAKLHQGIGSVIAIAGAIIAVIGWKMYDPADSALGISDEGARWAMRGGLVAMCVGCLWYAAGRVMRSK